MEGSAEHTFPKVFMLGHSKGKAKAKALHHAASGAFVPCLLSLCGLRQFCP